MNHRSEVEGMDTVEEHYHPMNRQPEVEGMDGGGDSGMGEDMTVELKMVEREPESVALARNWTDDGAVRHQRARREWDELVK
jgi:hypothetical protein